MSRPKQHDTASDRVMAFRKRHRIVHVTVKKVTAETLARIAEEIGESRTDLTAAMVEMALNTPEFAQASFPRVDARLVETVQIAVRVSEWAHATLKTLPGSPSANARDAISFALFGHQWSRFGIPNEFRVK